MIFNWISPPNSKPHNMAYAIPWGKNYKIIYAHFLILNSILLTWSWWRISFVNIRNDSVNTANLNEIFSRKCETEKYGRYIKALVRTQESDSRVTICWLGEKNTKDTCVQSGASICIIVWKWSEGTLLLCLSQPYLKTFAASIFAEFTQSHPY